MPGQFNPSPSQDGGDAFTTSAANSGFFAHNDATSPAPPGSVGGNGVFGLSTVPNASGVFGANNNGGVGVAGNSDEGDGVFGTSNGAGKSGVVGINNAPFDNSNGVFGGCGIAGNAIHGVGGTNVGLFDGHVQINGGVDVTGELTVLGGKHFRIDHPCDPANKYLLHCSVEAPEMLYVYSGNVITDKDSTATVLLPSYFEALNQDFRYQLTVVGSLRRRSSPRRLGMTGSSSKWISPV
jgi:trimeric autotransporter adhesin